MAHVSILSRQLGVYSLPTDLLLSLSVRSIQAQTENASASSAAVESSSTNADVGSTAFGGLKCQTCPGAVFETLEEQRSHFRSDWHRYNAKAKLANRAITADEWDGMVEGVSSISGTASSSSSGSSQSRITRLLKKAKVNNNTDVNSDEEAEIAELRRRAQLRTAVIWFTSSSSDALGIPIDTQLGIHRALFPPFELASDYLDELKRMQLSEVSVDESEERRLTLLMVAGGHFAGMVVSLRPRARNERQEVKGAGEIRILKHKTFHRYTTRKKQGGSQALNDNAKSKAVSAGAMLRRYGEQALQEEIRALLSEWEDDLRISERIFIRASTHGKRSFWGYDGAVLEKTDDRIRAFPFPTRRPTLQELLRCWHELTRVKVSHLSEAALAAQDEAYISSIQPKRRAVARTSIISAPAPVPSLPKLSPEEEARHDRQRRLVDMVKKGRLDPLRDFYERYGEEISPSILGVAAAAGQEDVVRFLLVDARLDPSSPLEGGKRAYDLASTKGVRNLFRRVAFDQPDLWDWKDARVPSGLSEEAEAEQGARKAERRRGLRDKMRERERARSQPEVEQDTKQLVTPLAPQPASFASLGSQKLGGRTSAEGSLAGLSSEMRLQIERERRARAAEARFK